MRTLSTHRNEADPGANALGTQRVTGGVPQKDWRPERRSTLSWERLALCPGTCRVAAETACRELPAEAVVEPRPAGVLRPGRPGRGAARGPSKAGKQRWRDPDAGREGAGEGKTEHVAGPKTNPGTEGSNTCPCSVLGHRNRVTAGSHCVVARLEQKQPERAFRASACPREPNRQRRKHSTSCRDAREGGPVEEPETGITSREGRARRPPSQSTPREEY